MEKLLQSEVKLNELSPLNLAFVGDAVFELFVRERIVSKGNFPVKKLHQKSVEYVNCQAQSKYLTEKLIPVFTQKETEIYLRGRNAHVGHIPKNAKPADYHYATALEAVFGYLYLAGEIERLRELFAMIL